MTLTGFMVTACGASHDTSRAGVVTHEAFGAYHQTVEVNFHPVDADCTATADDLDRTVRNGELLNLSVKASPLTIACRKSGYRSQARTVVSDVDIPSEQMPATYVGGGAYAAGAGFAAGLISGAVKGMKGTRLRYPPIVHVVLEPEDVGEDKGPWAKDRRDAIHDRWRRYVASCKRKEGQHCRSESMQLHWTRDVSLIPPDDPRALRTASAITAAFSQMAVTGETHPSLKTLSNAWTFNADGTLSGERAPVRVRGVGNDDVYDDPEANETDSGVWRADRDRLCLKWDNWERGIEHCYFIIAKEGRYSASGPGGKLLGEFSLVGATGTEQATGTTTGEHPTSVSLQDLANGAKLFVRNHERGRDEGWTLDTKGTMRGTYSNPGLAWSRTGSDNGSWRVDGEQLCLHWQNWYDGRETCYAVDIDGTKIAARGDDGEAIWSGTVNN